MALDLEHLKLDEQAKKGEVFEDDSYTEYEKEVDEMDSLDSSYKFHVTMEPKEDNGA